MFFLSRFIFVWYFLSPLLVNTDLYHFSKKEFWFWYIFNENLRDLKKSFNKKNSKKNSCKINFLTNLIFNKVLKSLNFLIKTLCLQIDKMRKNIHHKTWLSYRYFTSGFLFFFRTIIILCLHQYVHTRTNSRAYTLVLNTMKKRRSLKKILK